MKRYGVCPSVRPSLCPIRPLQQHAAGRRYRSITCRSGAVVGVRIGSWTQTCFAVSFACSADTSCVVAEMVRVLGMTAVGIFVAIKSNISCPSL